MAMPVCPRSMLDSRLQSLNQSQQSIEGTSRWLLFYSHDAHAIVKAWLEAFLLAPVDRALAMLYVASHTMQEGRKKTGGAGWVESFGG